MNGTYDPYLLGGVVSILGLTVGALIWVIKFMFNKLIPRLDKGNEAIGKLVVATNKNMGVIKSADTYLRDRNGRDATTAQLLVDTTISTHHETIKAIKSLQDSMSKTAVTTAKTLLKAPLDQHVEHQDVRVQTVGKK